MANRNYQENPAYYTKCARSWAESTRNAEYACSIYSFREDREHHAAAWVIAAFFIILLAAGLYFDKITEFLKWVAKKAASTKISLQTWWAGKVMIPNFPP